jgi:hypothetical protein
MPSRFTRVAALIVFAAVFVAVGLWLAPAARRGGQVGAAAAPVEAYRADAGTALLYVKPPRGAPAESSSDTWQRMIGTHAARLGAASVFAEVLAYPTGAATKARWYAARGTPQHAGAVEALRRATTIRTIPGTALIAVRVEVGPPADAAGLTEEICFEYIKQSKDAEVKAFQDEVKLLGRELAMVKIELDTEVSPHILAKEKDLGGDAVSTIDFNANQGVITHLLEERFRIALELSVQQVRFARLSKQMEEGKVPAAIRRRVREHPEWLRASERLVGAEAELEAAKAAAPVDAKAVAAREKQRDARKERLGRLRDELAKELSEIERDEARSREHELLTQAAQVDRRLDELSKRMGELNQMVGEYRTLKERERELRDRISALNARMTHINQFEINAPSGPVEWAQRPGQ